MGVEARRWAWLGVGLRVVLYVQPVTAWCEMASSLCRDPTSCVVQVSIAGHIPVGAYRRPEPCQAT